MDSETYNVTGSVQAGMQDADGDVDAQNEWRTDTGGREGCAGWAEGAHVENGRRREFAHLVDGEGALLFFSSPTSWRRRR